MKFLTKGTPIITGMIKSLSEERILSEIERIREDGADAYGFQLEGVHGECKSPDTLRRILFSMSDKPVYFTNYMRRNSTEGITWERLEEEIIFAAECGASLIDIPGDMYSSADMELTHDPSAIARQMALIDRLHSMGCEVLMSSHVLRYIPSGRVIEIALEHQRRGADVTKIVIDTNTKAELGDAFIASVRLAEEVRIGTLLLCNGEYSRTHRHLGPLFGSALFLATENNLSGQDQPTVARAKEVLRFNNTLGGGFLK